MRRKVSGLFISLILLCAALWVNHASGAHLMGGSLTYKYVGNNRYALNFLIYRDANCTNCVAMPTDLCYYAYAGSYVAKSDFSVYSTHNAVRSSLSYVKPDAPSCSLPVGVNVQQGVFLDTFTAGSDSLGYHITWFSNGFRNGAIILNLNQASNCNTNPSPFSMLWYTFIPANSFKNSSPQFLTVPVPYLCVGRTNILPAYTSDPDNDSLVYSLEVPYSPAPCLPNVAGCNAPIPYPLGHPNFQKVNYLSGYSVTDPFGTGSTSCTIDPHTGTITATPTKQGAYVIAVQVNEYRYDPVRKKSVYMDFVRRDLEFIVGNSCGVSSSGGGPNTPIFSTTATSTNLTVAPGDSLVFDVGGYASNSTDSMHIRATGGVFSGSNATTNAPYATFTASPFLDYKAKVNGHFVWHPSCQQITYSSPFVVTFNLSDQSCNEVFQTYEITVLPRTIQSPPLLKCANIASASSINLSFSNSASQTDFLQYKIYRAVNNSNNFVLVDSISSFTKTSWTDTKATNIQNTI